MVPDLAESMYKVAPCGDTKTFNTVMVVRVPVPVLGTQSMTRQYQPFWRNPMSTWEAQITESRQSPGYPGGLNDLVPSVLRVLGRLKLLSSARHKDTWGAERAEPHQSQWKPGSDVTESRKSQGCLGAAAVEPLHPRGCPGS